MAEVDQLVTVSISDVQTITNMLIGLVNNKSTENLMYSILKSNFDLVKEIGHESVLGRVLKKDIFEGFSKYFVVLNDGKCTVIEAWDCNLETMKRQLTIVDI